MDGRLDESRMANCMPSKLQPFATVSLMIRSSDSSVTDEVSTTLYDTSATVTPREVFREVGDDAIRAGAANGDETLVDDAG